MKKCLWVALMLIVCTAVPIWADDTEIYGTVTNPDLEPNILIIFDSSGSMSTVDVPGDPYDPAITYAGSYLTDTVYQRYWDKVNKVYIWQLFASDLNDLNCDAAKNELLSDGNTHAKIRATSYTCGGNIKRRLRLGNYMNYDESGIGIPLSRIDVAKQVVTDLLTMIKADISLTRSARIKRL
jgi:type IV pilus assembly protein PilY1